MSSQPWATWSRSPAPSAGRWRAVSAVEEGADGAGPRGGASTSTAAHLAKRELLTPDEVMRLGAALEILLRQGQAPVIARKVRYYDDEEFQRLYSQGPKPR
ncbi:MULTISPECIES: type IV secretory system conjugative DNA transfer family protein [unclassified Phenylobacterium]|uniref:type IV secretory system conjugative DNA transfer family protein n=1 Tax=unclassified Phenylobacterium TaxID=2640670 RepID=UPI0009EAE133|nr:MULTISPECIES: type IV secretory system conjugative DNA transfer family protein [unclassified Phenylobacterium]